MRTPILFIPLLVFLTCGLSPAPDQGTLIKLPKSISKDYSFIPMSKTMMDGEMISVMAFFLSSKEISNRQYREFLYDLKTNGLEEDYRLATIDSTGWDIPHAYCEPMKVHYHIHPAYNEYPVVNISQIGARLYCAWLEKKLNSENPQLKYSVRLPKRAELLAAGRCGVPDRPYAWDGNSLNDPKGKPMCNYWMIRQEAVHRNPNTNLVELLSPSMAVNGFSFMTSLCGSYQKNEWGIYDLCGNVAEMVEDGSQAAGGSWYSTGYDVMLSTLDSISGPNPRTGFRPVISVIKAQ
jgi:formylglycine-generating enzyme required for sulfatase activity